MEPLRGARTAWANLNIARPLVAWLVYRGEMVSSSQAHAQALGFWLTNALSAESRIGHRSASFRDEVALETVRCQRVPRAVSRLSGFYLFDDRTSAEVAATTWGRNFRRDALEEVGILTGSRWSRHDAQWITLNMGTGATGWIEPYLRGEPAGPDPIWELLVDGRAVVFGTRFREAAYDVVKRTWPQSLALLELGRVAAEVQSDLGLILPMIHGAAPHARRVDYMINMEDAEDPGFLKRVEEYDGPWNTADVRPGADIALPDLRAQGFSLPAA
jgi:hypothetical protein